MGRPPVHIIEKNDATPLLPGREIEEEEKRGKRRKINERENECSGGSGGGATDI